MVNYLKKYSNINVFRRFQEQEKELGQLKCATKENNLFNETKEIQTFLLIHRLLLEINGLLTYKIIRGGIGNKVRETALTGRKPRRQPTSTFLGYANQMSPEKMDELWTVTIMLLFA